MPWATWLSQAATWQADLRYATRGPSSRRQGLAGVPRSSSIAFAVGFARRQRPADKALIAATLSATTLEFPAARQAVQVALRGPSTLAIQYIDARLHRAHKTVGAYRLYVAAAEIGKTTVAAGAVDAAEARVVAGRSAAHFIQRPARAGSSLGIQRADEQKNANKNTKVYTHHTALHRAADIRETRGFQTGDLAKGGGVGGD